MKKILFGIILALALLVLIAKFAGFLPAMFGIKEKAGIRISSTPEASVLIDNQMVGKTPFQSDNLDAKEVTVKLTSDNGSWEGKVTLRPHTITFINRDLSDDSSIAAGEILTLEKGTGITVISNPSGTDVAVDGTSVGTTPGTFSVGIGEHTFVISRNGFLNRSIKATIPENYNLTIAVDLANSESVTDVVTPSPTPSPSTNTIKVLATPTGFLRVRDKASTAGKEIAQVKPGDELEFIEVTGSWTKVKLSDGSEGYVSSQYVSKSPSSK